jgi:hypothetical protein
MADVDGELGGVGARDQIGRTEIVQELLEGEPAATAHYLVFHHGDVRRGAADRPVLEESHATSPSVLRSAVPASWVVTWPST